VGRRLLLVLAIATLTACAPGARGPKRRLPVAASIVEKVRAAYREAPHYVDSGRMIGLGLIRGRWHTLREVRFRTAYVRDKRLRFDTAHLRLWVDGMRAFTIYPSMPTRRAWETKLEHANVTTGVASLPMSELVRGLPGDGGIDLDSMRVLGRSQIRDQECSVLGRVDEQGDWSFVWVDATTHLVLRTQVERRTSSRGVIHRFRTQIDYDARLDAPSDADIEVPSSEGAVPFQTKHHIGVSLGPPKPSRVISDVSPGSPAESAGIAVGDELLAIDGEEVHDLSDLYAIVARAPAGSELELELRRGGAPYTARVVVAEYP
jgi:hypothetical protein